MEKEESNNIFRNDEIDLFQIFNLLYLQKKIISYIVLSFVIVAVLFSIFIPNQYKSSTVLAPTQDSGSALTGMQSQVGGLASLAGISLGKGKADEATIALTVMRSWGFIESFLNEANISHEVYASTGWDKDSNKLIFDRSIYDPDKKEWKKKPNGWNLYQSFMEKITIARDFESGLVTISVETFSPIHSKKWLDLYVSAINEHMRKRKTQQVDNNIRYLNQEISKTSIAEMREVFYKVIQEQIKEKMLAEATPDYAFKVVNQSMIPVNKSSPVRSFIVVIGAIVGFLTAILFIFFRPNLRNIF